MSEASGIDIETETNRTAAVEQNKKCAVSQVELENSRESPSEGGEEEGEGEGESSVLLAHPKKETARERGGGGRGHFNSSISENDRES